MVSLSSEPGRSAAAGVKQMNRSNIYMLLHKTGPMSRQSVVYTLGLSLPTVVQNLTQMQQEGLIEEAGLQSNTGGRRAMTYSIVHDFRVAIGLDITMYHVSAVVVDLHGAILSQIRRNIAFSRTEDYFICIATLVDELIRGAALRPEQILGVGISLPGLINADGTTCYYCNVLHTDSISQAEFARYIPYPVRLQHDVMSSAFAESWQGETSGSFFYIMLSHSIGGAVFLNDGIYSGVNNRSGELGHMQLVENGRLCYCGRRGCADPYCSSKPLVALTDGNLAAFFDQLEAGDPEVRRVWDEYLHFLARVIHNLRMLFDSRIVLGGHIGERIGPYIVQLKEQVQRLDPFSDPADCVEVCRVKTESSAVGAALRFIDQFLTSI